MKKRERGRQSPLLITIEKYGVLNAVLSSLAFIVLLVLVTLVRTEFLHELSCEVMFGVL